MPVHIFMGKAVRVLPESQLEPLDDVERFLPMIRFENRGEMEELGLKFD